jgi:molybdopterin-containing oxidoreductase family membrane subunit
MDQHQSHDELHSSVHATHAVVGSELTFGSVTDKISAIVLKRKTPISWFIGFAVSFALFQLMMLAITKLLFVGIGMWGVNVPVAWGMDILNFVWWIGIGHAGTLISAILLLLRQQWRTSINRFAEAMTLFAVAQAGMYPIMHLGRPWLAYWLFPYPNTMGIWPQFRSPLMWDVFAVSTYATVSAVFWFVGLIPDFATLRDRAKHPIVQHIYGILAMGWRNAANSLARSRYRSRPCSRRKCASRPAATRPHTLFRRCGSRYPPFVQRIAWRVRGFLVL